MVNTVSILTQARGLIKQGWVKWSSKTTKKSGLGYRYCATGAVREVATLTGAGYALERRAVRTLDRVAPRKYGDSVSYNDAKGVKKADVIRLYDRAIRSAKTGRFVRLAK